MFTNKKVLVTGGSGFIGNELMNVLVKNKNDVVVIDKLSTKNINQNIKFYQKDLTILNDIIPLFENVDIVYHLASDISIKNSVENPNQFLYNNTLLHNNVLECCRLNGIKKIIFSSTSAVYKEKINNDYYSEDDDLNPLNPYSLSKLYGENLCKIYSNLYNLKVIILRYFNVYGNLNITNNYASVLNNFIYAYKNKKSLTINGNGEQTRDFVHIYDVIKANLLASEVDLNNQSEIFNIGQGISVSIKEIAETISDNIIHVPQAKGELKFSKANIKKANELLNWHPKEDLKSWLKGVLK